ncbi:MAG: hypothetical protein Q9201_004892 [Fulgogasparrea decipioides]
MFTTKTSTTSIRNPPRPFPNAPIIIYLPSGLPTNASKQDPLTTLSLSANATTIRISYRLSPQLLYPRPIHDILAAYDWIRAHLILNKNHPQPSKIGVCGEYIGGSLAAMLALTECYPQKPGGITAAVLGNPIVDWSAPFGMPQTPDKGSELEADIASLRENLFAQPAHRYDPFTSPLLFFRTPGWELPPDPIHGAPSSDEANNPDGVNSRGLIAKRRSHRKYPPLGSGLRLPLTRVSVGETSMLKDQALELAELMQRSVNIYERESHGREGSGTDMRKRVEVAEQEGTGMWGEKEHAESGAWLGEALRSTS